jgi:hypothetical protein
MSFHTMSDRQISNRLSCINLPTLIKNSTFDIFKKWRDKSGLEWATLRFKAIKSDFLQFKADGRKTELPWVAKTRAGNLKGIFGELRSLMETKAWVAVIKLLNLYTSTILTEITKTQFQKWSDSMKRPVKDISQGIKVLFNSPTLRRLKPKYPRVCHLIESAFKPTLITRVFPEITSFNNSSEYRRFQLEHSWMEKRFFENVFQERRPDEPMIGSVRIDFANLGRDRRGRSAWAEIDRAVDFKKQSYSAGRVGFTQEPGGKLRVYFDPKLYFQGMLQPLQSSLNELLQRLPWDCTHFQSKAIGPIQERLRSGHKVYSFDLSDATNIFPWGLQHLVLEKLYGLSPIVRLLASLVDSGSWDGPGGPWRFIRGQAMGLEPSFALFGLTHGLMVEGLLTQPWDEQFFVLGDDLVILDDEVALKYSALLENLDVPISKGKTFVSNNIAEFAGYLVTRDKSFIPPKYKSWDARNIVSMVKNCPEWVEIAPAKAKPVLRWVLSLPEPYGLGLNPKGVPYLQRMTIVTEELIKEEPPLKREVSLTEKWLKFQQETWTPTSSTLSHKIEKSLRRLDQRRREKLTFPKWKIPTEVSEDIEGQVNNPRLPLKTKVKPPQKRKLPLTFWRRIYNKVQRTLANTTATEML